MCVYMCMYIYIYIYTYIEGILGSRLRRSKQAVPHSRKTDTPCHADQVCITRTVGAVTLLCSTLLCSALLYSILVYSA